MQQWMCKTHSSTYVSLARCKEGVSMETVLGHPIGPVPTSIFHADGTTREKKAELRHQLEAQYGRVWKLPESNSAATVYIRDAMAVIKMMTEDTFHSFDALTAPYFRQLLTGFKKPTQLVFDRYDEENSVKTAEPAGRIKSAYKQYHVIGGRLVSPRKDVYYRSPDDEGSGGRRTVVI